MSHCRMRSIGSRIGTVSGKVPIGTGAMELGLITCRFLEVMGWTPRKVKDYECRMRKLSQRISQ